MSWTEHILIKQAMRNRTRLLETKEGKGMYLSNMNLCESDLRNANLEGATLMNANLWGADLQGANLKNADLKWANLKNANLKGTNLDNADLYGADFECPYMNGICTGRNYTVGRTNNEDI